MSGTDIFYSVFAGILFGYSAPFITAAVGRLAPAGRENQAGNVVREAHINAMTKARLIDSAIQDYRAADLNDHVRGSIRNGIW